MTTTVTFAVDGMHCASCSMLIDETLEDIPGVSSSTTSRRLGRTTVELDQIRATPAQIAAAISELGYQAQVLA